MKPRLPHTDLVASTTSTASTTQTPLTAQPLRRQQLGRLGERNFALPKLSSVTADIPPLGKKPMRPMPHIPPLTLLPSFPQALAGPEVIETNTTTEHICQTATATPVPQKTERLRYLLQRAAVAAKSPVHDLTAVRDEMLRELQAYALPNEHPFSADDLAPLLADLAKYMPLADLVNLVPFRSLVSLILMQPAMETFHLLANNLQAMEAILPERAEETEEETQARLRQCPIAEQARYEQCCARHHNVMAALSFDISSRPLWQSADREWKAFPQGIVFSTLILSLYPDNNDVAPAGFVPHSQLVAQLNEHIHEQLASLAELSLPQRARQIKAFLCYAGLSNQKDWERELLDRGLPENIGVEALSKDNLAWLTGLAHVSCEASPGILRTINQAVARTKLPIASCHGFKCSFGHPDFQALLDKLPRKEWACLLGAKNLSGESSLHRASPQEIGAFGVLLKHSGFDQDTCFLLLESRNSDGSPALRAFSPEQIESYGELLKQLDLEHNLCFKLLEAKDRHGHPALCLWSTQQMKALGRVLTNLNMRHDLCFRLLEAKDENGFPAISLWSPEHMAVFGQLLTTLNFDAHARFRLLEAKDDFGGAALCFFCPEQITAFGKLLSDLKLDQKTCFALLEGKGAFQEFDSDQRKAFAQVVPTVITDPALQARLLATQGKGINRDQPRLQA